MQQVKVLKFLETHCMNYNFDNQKNWPLSTALGMYKQNT